MLRYCWLVMKYERALSLSAIHPLYFPLSLEYYIHFSKDTTIRIEKYEQGMYTSKHLKGQLGPP